MPTWLLFSLSAALLFACGQILVKKGLMHISPLWNNIITNVLALIIWVPTVLVLSNFSIVIPSPLILLTILIGGACYSLFFYAISKGSISLTGPLSALYPVSTVLLSFIFLHERIYGLQYVGISASLIGVFLIALPEKNIGKLAAKHFDWVIWGIASALVSGTGDFLAKVVSNSIGSYSQIFFLAILAQGLSIGNFLLDKKGRTVPRLSGKKMIPTLLGTIILSIGMMLFLLALRFGKASLVVPVSSIYPGLIVLFAALFLGERVTKKQLYGVIGIIAGIMMIGLG